MTETTVADTFLEEADRYRPELLAHCYRILGSVHDAEDQVQETYLRAWRASDKFEGRSSMRTWLYRIATNTCLTALESRGRRPLPTDMAPATDHPEGDLVQRQEVPWLEPIPDSHVAGAADDPAAIVASRESIRLGFVAALQHLPPRQRVVLLLRDVLRWRAAEVAELLDTTTTAVNSTLQRARAQLERVAPAEDEVAAPLTAEQRELLERYVRAFNDYDMAALEDLFTSDAIWEMPPFLTWVRGGSAIRRLISRHCPATGPGDQFLVPTVANGQPAFGLYMRGEDGAYYPFNLQVLTLTAAGVAHAVAFFDLSLFEVFNLPDMLSSASEVPTGEATQVRSSRRKR